MPVATEAKTVSTAGLSDCMPMEVDMPSKDLFSHGATCEGVSVLKCSQVDMSGDTDTIIIFDWDDTLLASSFLSANGYRLDNQTKRTPDVDAQLQALERSVTAVLTLALKYGEVHVVTNAETGWVQLSAQKFLPSVVPLLSQVTVISARSTYEEMYPEAPLRWKFCAFQDRLQAVAGRRSQRNVISFGDSHVEREAVRAVTRGLPNTKTKSVKFAERPSMEQLRRQIELVIGCFEYIYSHESDLDLMLTISLIC